VIDLATARRIEAPGVPGRIRLGLSNGERQAGERLGYLKFRTMKDWIAEHQNNLPEPQESLPICILGGITEWAAAMNWGLPEPDGRYIPNAPDIGRRTDVKAIDKPGNHLLVPEYRLHVEWIYLLAYWNAARSTVHFQGWQSGAWIKANARVKSDLDTRTDKPRPCYFVENPDLLDVRDLSRDML
jgi:hypothetical protein